MCEVDRSMSLAHHSLGAAIGVVPRCEHTTKPSPSALCGSVHVSVTWPMSDSMDRFSTGRSPAVPLAGAASPTARLVLHFARHRRSQRCPLPQPEGPSRGPRGLRAPRRPRHFPAHAEGTLAQGRGPERGVRRSSHPDSGSRPKSGRVPGSAELTWSDRSAKRSGDGTPQMTRAAGRRRQPGSHQTERDLLDHTESLVEQVVGHHE